MLAPVTTRMLSLTMYVCFYCCSALSLLPVFAHDDDRFSGDVITHSLLPVDDYLEFELDSYSGDLRSLYELNYEARVYYTIQYRAVDSTGRQDSGTLNIVVKNLNEVCLCSRTRV